MAGIEVIIEDLKNHPICPHGPTILFSHKANEIHRRFFACAACRDQKSCKFLLYEDEQSTVSKYKQKMWEKEKIKFLKNIKHRKLYLALNETEKLSENQRIYCRTCSTFEFNNKFLQKHQEHELIKSISDHQLRHPTEFLLPLDNAKKEAQFLFAQSSVVTIVEIVKQLNYEKVICIGTPRIHEFITNECPELSSLLLDIDGRFHNFWGPLQFCWYNCFNHHFFFQEAKEVFEDFLQGGQNTILITDPPFGGRVELLAHTIQIINNQFRFINQAKCDLGMFWMFPYFMEPQIVNSLPNFSMLDYKVDYDNHPLFNHGPNGRKQGSPVRIFTNLDPRKIVLPEGEGYKYCKKCKKWTSPENRHCKQCNSCTSKDGRTYIHCNQCTRCVKPTWIHCEKCQRCSQPDHKCGKLKFTQECFHCKVSGHKKRDCPKVDHEKLHMKRTKQFATNLKTKRKRLK